MAHEPEILDAELVDDERLPARARPSDARPVLTQHTILRPGEMPATQRPQYSERDFYVSEETARRMDEAAAPKNTDKNYRSQRGMFQRWCDQMGRVANPCTTATYVEYIAGMIARGYAPSSIRTHKSAIRSWQPDDAKPGTSVVNGMIKEYAKEWGKRNRVKKAPAITDAMFRAMVASCDQHHPIGIRDRCALILGRGNLHRRIELADLICPQVEKISSV
ncbi:hypothetical protein ABZ383_35475 [Streptomyces sp. NPDC005900]|uniref:hypothetical protein n=1 Tax=Streptomyces sp. NPDC005900 TaxID=3154569 RepID=UPI003401DC0E